MRAVWYERAGGAEVLELGELPDPEPGPGEVRVRLHRSAVNPTDVKRRLRGRELDRFARIVPGNDGAGVIDAIGTGVPERRLGERVWVFGAQAGRPHGTAAQLCTVPSRQALVLPESVSFETGACLGVPAVTAYHALHCQGPPDERTVLVDGAAGRVGHYAVQLARLSGARVGAVTGSEQKAQRLQELGLEHVFVHGAPGLAERIRAELGGVDHVVEAAFGSNIGWLPQVLEPNAVVAAYASDGEPEPRLPFYPLMYNNTTVCAFAIFGLPAAAQDHAFAGITRALEAQALAHRIDSVLPLAACREAHERVELGVADGVLQLDIAGG